MTFDVVENPVTGERGIIRLKPESDTAPLVADLYARPGAAVVGEHVHPTMTETFTVVRGTLALKLDGVESRADAGTRIVVPPGTAHDWWNAGAETAWVLVEVDPGRRFEAMIRNLFGLAADGRTDRKGRPGLLQASLLAREFDDTIRFTAPPRFVQRPLFAALAPLARWRGLKGSYPEYLRHTGETVTAVEDVPPEISAMVPYLDVDRSRSGPVPAPERRRHPSNLRE